MAPGSATGILIELLGAVALLLWGTRMVRTGIMRTFGADLRHVLRVSLRNRFAAFLAGLGVTGVLQSSTATALVVAAFAGRGVVETAPALAVMLGADLGSSLVAQVLSRNLHWLAPILILVGVIIHLSAQGWSHHGLGRVAIGLGLMLLALRLILAASAPMRGAIILEEVFGALAHDVLILGLVGALLTWLAHSSLAIVLLIMSLAGVGVLPLTSAFALVLGANLGATLPAVTATYADRPAARRVALGNLLFRLAGVVVCLPVVSLVVPWVSGPEPGPEPGRGRFPHGLQPRARARLSSCSPTPSPGFARGFCPTGRSRPIPSSRAISTARPSTARAWRSPARPARRCAWAI